MDVLLVGEKNYVKASVIARELGYTADYVGQLCRAKKVNAKLVGRSWYVERDSIHGHKKSRYRSTQGSTKRELANSIRVREDDPVTVSNFYTHHERTKGPEYIKDTSELIPAVSKHPKSVRLDIGLADAKAVKVNSESSSYTFERPVLPQIKFEGKLKVTDIPDNAEPEAPENGTLIHPKEVNALKSEKRAKNIVVSDSSTTELRTPKTPVTFADRVSKNVVVEEEEDVQARVAINRAETASLNSSVVVFIVLTSFVAACIASIILYSLEAHGSYVSPQSVAWSYQVDLQKFLQLFSSHFGRFLSL